MIDNQQDIKLDSKLRIINVLYLSKSNCIIHDNQQFHKERYLITLNSQADLSNSLAKVCELFTDTIYQTKANCRIFGSLRFNLLFEFMVKLYYLQDSFLPRIYKETQATLMTQYEIIDDLSYSFRTNKQIREDFQNFNITCKRFVQEQLKIQSSNDGFIRLKKIRKKLLQIYKNMILSISKDGQQTLKRRRYYIPFEMQENPSLFITKTLITLVNIRFTKKKYRLLKFQNYLNNYKHFFSTKIYRINQKSSQIIKQFTIRRYSNLKINSDLSPNEMLITIENLIRIRKKDSINDTENIQIIRMLGNELVRHKKSTGCYYPNLCPKYVMFNQLSLQTQLSYYPPILEGLGFLKRPSSIEQIIAFKSSPQPFDQFAAPNEIAMEKEDPQNEIEEEVFNNYLFGIDDLIQKENQKNLKTRGKKLVASQAKGKTMSQIQQQQQQYSQTWRYIMTSSYILNSKVFSKEYITNANAFKKFLKKQAGFVGKDQGKFIQTVLGSKFAQYLHENERQSLKRQKKFTISIFDNFLREGKEIIDENIQLQKIQDFVLGRTGIIGDITQLLKKDQKSKYLNIDKYLALLILFYLHAYQYLTNIKVVLSLAIKDVIQVKKLIENKQICKILCLIDKNIGTLKSIQKFHQNLSSAKEKAKDKKHSSLYQNYQRLFQQIDQTRKICLSCNQIMKKQSSLGFEEESHCTYQQIIAQINPILAFCLQNVLQICQKEVSCFRKDQFAEQIDRYIIFLSINVKIKYFLFHTPWNSIKLSLVRENLNIEINTEDKKRTVQILQYCLSIISQEQKSMASLKGKGTIW